MGRFTYSRWDGTQDGFDVAANEIFSQLTDELAYHGDPNQALRRLLQGGFDDHQGRRVAGMRELLERLRTRRRELLAAHDLGGAYEDVVRRLREVVDMERAGLDALEDEARSSGDDRRIRQAEAAASDKRMALDLLAPDPAGRIAELRRYEWASDEARGRFDELIGQLRGELMASTFNKMSEALSATSGEELARSRDMLNDLNAMIEARFAGKDTDGLFAVFMDRYGDMFPGSPGDLDELLEVMARQMAAMAQMLNSMSPQQRAELEALSDALMEDIDLRWQVERLGANLRLALPQAGWDAKRNFEGPDPVGFGEAGGLLGELGDIDQLENLLSSGSSSGALAEVDLERAAELLGADDLRSLEAMAKVARQLREAGLIDQREGRIELTPRGLRRIGQNALSELFSRLVAERMGRHAVEQVGLGLERTYETKPYEWGDPFNLAIERTVRNALSRGGAGTPVRLSPGDFEIERTETATATSTVLALDLSLSMPMGDNFLAAKKVAIALQSLISTQYPRDYLGLVGFGEVARELRPEVLAEVAWDYTYGTNIQHALILGRRMLARRSGTRQIILITDGEPTAHLIAGSDRAYFAYPPSPETIRLTLGEVARATRQGITINTFMLGSTPYLRDFVEKMTRLNSGRAFFATPETLGEYVLVDFLDHKRNRRSSQRRFA